MAASNLHKFACLCCHIDKVIYLYVCYTKTKTNKHRRYNTYNNKRRENKIWNPFLWSNCKSLLHVTINEQQNSNSHNDERVSNINIGS